MDAAVNTDYVEPSKAPMTVFEAIYSLRATRIYKGDPISQETLDQILQAGTMACSSGNTQPWEFVVVTSPELKAQIKHEMEIGFPAADAVRLKTREELVDSTGRSVTGHAAIESLQRASALVVVCWNPKRGVRRTNEYSTNPDGTLREERHVPGGRGVSLFPACQNMMLAANALGVSSLFTTFFSARYDQIKEILGIPPEIFMECCVFLGYADERLGRPKRKPVGEVSHLNRWGSSYDLSA
jgi:nitroreductase